MNNSKPSLLISFIPVVVLVTLLVFNVIVYSDDATYGPNQLALLFAAATAALIGVFKYKQDYRVLEAKALESVGVALQACLILLIVGSLIGAWILSGVVPTMIYYGIKVLHPSIFLPAACVICALTSLATGSSWSTVGTIGIALIGIGSTLGLPMGLVAGAIVSGAYFGDKMSALSDTTNLAPAMAGAELFEHIKHMLYTTVPSIIIALILYTLIGFSYSADTLDTKLIENVLAIMDSNFNISPFLFILPLVVFILVGKKVPAIPALLMGTLLGIVFALIFQQDLLTRMIGNESSGFFAYYNSITDVLFSGFKIETGNKLIDDLFSRGGMSGMLNTVWLIFVAMIFGGMMEVTGFLHTIAESIVSLVRGVVSLVSATIVSAIFLNLTTSDQYISIVVTGRMFKNAFQKLNLHPKNLSRAVEDGATVTSVLVPWNTCGAYFASVMGVATLSYLPFAFFNLLSPLASIAVAAHGKTMVKVSENGEEKES
jgi:NhaC family Na+:H+ antiporter